VVAQPRVEPTDQLGRGFRARQAEHDRNLGRAPIARVARGDFYALGVTHYECLAGELPFVRSSGAAPAAAMILAVAEITPVRQLRHDVPHELAAIVERCMQRKPGDRYPNARTLGSALAELLSPRSSS
jgi:serine/threonine protein kinase